MGVFRIDELNSFSQQPTGRERQGLSARLRFSGAFWMRHSDFFRDKNHKKYVACDLFLFS
jgi:hypothetical protein